MSNQLVSRMFNAVNDANMASQITYQVLTGDVDVPVNTSEGNIPTLSTRVRDFLADLLDGGDLNGDDGLSITDVMIDENGHLFITIEGQPPTDLGQIIPSDGVGVDTVRFNSNTGAVEFELDDGRTITLNNVAGEDGVTVSQAFIRTGDLILEMSDGTEINAGNVSQFGGLSASDAEINEQGQLVIIFSDGTTEVVGQVVGPRGRDGVSTIAGFVDGNGVLRFFRSDGSQYNAGQAIVPILDASGNTVEGARLVNEDLVLELSTGDLNIGRVVGVDGIDGEDGISVEEVYIDDSDNNLYVRLTGQAAVAVGEVRNTIFENADVAVTNASINDDGELVLDISVNGAIQTETIGVVNGANGRILVDAQFDVTTGTLTFTDDKGDTLSVGDIEQVIVTGATVDEVSGMLTIELSNGTSIDAGVVRGEDGVDGMGIVNAYMDSEGDFYVEFEDSAIPDALVGNILAPVETAAMFNGDDELVITLSDGQEFNVGKVKGVDGTFIENARIVDDEILIDFSDGTVDVVIGNVQNLPTLATVDPSTGKLSITFANGNVVTTDERVRGLDGDTITNVSFDSNVRDLLIDISTDNTNTTSRVRVPMVRGRSVDATYDETARQLTLSSNIPEDDDYVIDFPEPKDGDSVTDVRIEDDKLIIETNVVGSEYIEVDLPDSLSITNVELNPDNNIRIMLSDGREFILETIEGYVGIGIDTIEFVDNDLQLSITDGSTVTIPAVKGVDGDGIESITIDGSELVITTTLSDTPIRFQQLRGDDAPNTIESVQLVGNDLVFSLIDADDVVVPTVKGVDGNTINDISFDGNDLVIQTDIVGQETITLPAVKGVDGNSVTDVSVTSNDLVITTNIEGQETITIDGVKGIDGNSLLDVTLETNGDITLQTNIEGKEAITLPEVKGVDGNSLLDVTLETNGDITLQTNIEGKNTITLPEVKGVDGENGKNINSVEINASDELVITMDDDTPTVYTIPGVGTSVVDASINPTTGQLILDLSDGTNITTTDSIVGRDGNGTGIKSASFVNGELTFILSDAADNETTVEAGSVEMVSVTNARIDEQNQGSEGILVIEMSNGTEVTVGNVYGKDGRFVSTTDVNADGELILYMSDGTEVNAGNSLGKDGIYVESAEVLFSGDLLLTLTDGSTQNAGSVGSGAGLTVWRTEDVPYVKDRVVIYDGGLYMSAITDNSDEPPSGNWKPLALGDQLIEVRAPRVTSPINADTAFSVRPTLVASPYAAIVSIDEHDYREYQITSISDTEFNSPLFIYQNKDNSIQVGDDLTVNTSYLWRCRDASTRGYVSAWSDTGEFSVPEGIIEMPTVTIHVDENVNAAFAAPRFVSSDFVNSFNSEAHTSTDWRVIDAATKDAVYESLNDTTNLLEIIIPFGNLDPSTNYEIQVRHRANTVESPWSDALLFTTENSFDYVDKPVVYYDGDLQQVSLFDATFNGSTFRKTAQFANDTGNIPLIHTTSEWIVTNANTNDIIDTYEGSNFLTTFTLSATLQNNINYRIRVRYASERFGKSEWSDWLEFNAEQSIQAPTISTTEDVNGFPSGGVFESSEFVGINETHVSTDWQVRSFFTDDVVWESTGNTVNLTTLSFNESIPDDDYVIRVRYNGNNVTSAWSNDLDFYYGTPE